MGQALAPQDVPEHESTVFACGFTVDWPTNLRGWRQGADLVVRVRIESQVAFENSKTEWSSDIVTAHEALVLDLVKGHPRAVAAGAVQQILQMGGRIRRPDGFYRQTWNGVPPAAVGSEWVMFLQWDSRLDGFTLFYRELGAVQIVDGKIANTGPHQQWNGRPVEAFIKALRR